MQEKKQSPLANTGEFFIQENMTVHIVQCRMINVKPFHCNPHSWHLRPPPKGKTRLPGLWTNKQKLEQTKIKANKN